MMIPPTPGKIVDEFSEGETRIAVVEFDGKHRAIYLNLVPDAHVGDRVRFTAGFATERIAPGKSSGWVRAAELLRGGSLADLNLVTGHAYELLSQLAPDRLRKLLLLAQEKRFLPGQIVFPAGDRSSFLHLIVSGELALEEPAGGSLATVRKLNAGDAIGWSALTYGARTHFQARALSPVSTVAFPGEGLRLACERDPALRYALTKQVDAVLLTNAGTMGQAVGLAA